MTLWIDFILGLMVVEGVGLLTWRRVTGQGPSVLVPNLLAGAALLLAMRFALVGTAPVFVGAALLAGLSAHVADLRARWG